MAAAQPKRNLGVASHLLLVVRGFPSPPWPISAFFLFSPMTLLLGMSWDWTFFWQMCIFAAITHNRDLCPSAVS